MKSTALVLGTVNAPHSVKLDAPALAHCLIDPSFAKSKLGHMSVFFGEVNPHLQKDFAKEFHISHAALVTAAKAFANYTGESYPLAA